MISEKHLPSSFVSIGTRLNLPCTGSKIVSSIFLSIKVSSSPRYSLPLSCHKMSAFLPTDSMFDLRKL